MTRSIKYTLGAVLSLFLLLNLYMLVTQGVVLGGDSGRYISGADKLLKSQELTGKQPSYLGYIALVAFCQWLGLGVKGVVVMQIVLATISLITLFALGKELAGPVAGIVATILFVVDYDIWRFNLFILTDSVYISLVIIVSWLIHRAVEGNLWSRASVIPLIIFAATVRPTGWILLLCALTYWIWRSNVRASWRLVGIIGGVILFTSAMLMVPFFKTGLQNESLHQAAQNGVVVFGYDAWNAPILIKEAQLVAQPLLSGLQLLFLIILRLLAYFAHVRPFYSFQHNLAIALFLATLYPLAITGFVRSRTNHLTQLLGIVIAGHSAVLLVTFADWDGRFLLYILPCFFVLASSTIRFLRLFEVLCGPKHKLPN